MDRTRTAIIAGAGMGGLSAAVFLASRGWRVVIHEQAMELSEVGAGLLLKPNSTKALMDAGVFDLLPNKPSVIESSVFRDRNGRLVSQYDHAGILPFYCPLRTEVQTALVSRARKLGVEIKTSSSVVGAEAEGVMQLASGEPVRGDLVIGADGWRSRVRHTLRLGRSVRTLANGASRLVVPRDPSEPTTVYQEYWSGHRRIGLTPVEPGLLYVFLSCPNEDSRGAAVPIDLDSWAASFPGLSASLFERISRADVVRHSYNHVRVHKWSSGRVAIVGDATNALPATLAQGAGLAIMNASGLALELDATDDIETALANWEAKYRSITEATQRWSMRYLALSNMVISKYVRVQSATLSISRRSWLNNRMRIADRVMASPAGPVPLAVGHSAGQP